MAVHCRWACLAASAALALVCAAAWGKDAAPVVVRHLLWDANQRPLYQRCADAFEQLHPQIRVRLRQVGWDDYWSTLSTGFISNTAPDVFTQHLSRFPEFAANGVMLDLQPLRQRDAATEDIYEPGLLAMWRIGQQQLALPLDWDTIALAVNLDLLKAAGIRDADLQRLSWNPRDGGSFAKLIQRLTMDESGRRADEVGFDSRKVRVWGYQNPGHGGMMGQTEWSHFAASAGWSFQTKPWDAQLKYDDPVLAETLSWLATLPKRGWSATPAQMGRLGADALFLAGRVAMVPSGAWMATHFGRHARFEHAWVPLPIGPSGQRASMRNGLGLAVWSGTARAQAAWQWVRFAGSRECQTLVAQAGLVFPAVRGLAQEAQAVQARRGLRTSAFLMAAAGHTFGPPQVPRGAEINDLIGPAIERILSGRAAAEEVLPGVARKARALAGQPIDGLPKRPDAKP